MNAFLDTSVLVAAMVKAHPAHERCRPWLAKAIRGEHELCVSAHTLAELYAVLTALPTRPRIGPAQAWQLVEVNVLRHARVVALTAAEQAAAVRRVSEAGLAGGIVYDALIAAAASKGKAERIVTLNCRDFSRVWPGDPAMLCEP